MSDCSKHKKEVAGMSDMKELTGMVGDLHYETLAKFLSELSNKIYDDGIKDFNAGRTKLSSRLYVATSLIGHASHHILKACKISEPFMKV